MVNGFIMIGDEKIPVEDVKECSNSDYINLPMGKPFSIINMKSGKKLTHKEVVDRLKRKNLQKDEWILEV